MVRRRPSKSNTKSGPRAVNRKDARIKKWEKESDIPLDEVDQFHTSRDRILLDGERAEYDDSDDEEEVFALKGIPSDDSDDDEEEGADDDVGMDIGADKDDASTKRPAKLKGKGKGRVEAGSDEEEDAQLESEEETWGKAKSAYYASNADQIDSDDDEANELEEQEARRLQAKARDVLLDDDFGLEDAAAADIEEEDAPDLDEPLPAAVQPLPQDKKSLIRCLEKTSPETLALANDWEDTALKVVQIRDRIQKLETGAADALGLGMIHLHYQALITYATNLAFYLHLRTSEQYSQRPDALRTHPVFNRLVQLKEAVTTFEDLDFDASDTDLGSSEDDSELDAYDIDARTATRARKLTRQAAQLEFEDLAALLREAEEAMGGAPLAASEPPAKKSKKAKVAAGDKEPAKKKRRIGSDAAAAAVPAVFDLVEPEFIPAKHRASAPSAEPIDVYGDATTLTAADAEDKRARRKTLRFHTARIEGAAARRQNARVLLSGDDDVPYRERRREREARKLREALARGTAGQGGEDLDGEGLEARGEGEGKSKSKGKARAVEGDDGSDEEGADGYYALIQRQKKERKEQKKAEHDAAVTAARLEQETEDSADGPRALTRAILKNRGLTPHRSKSVRNPRVKKRERYEKAKRKLASQRAVYRDGPRDVTRYEGEKSGITKVAKSVRF